MHAWLNFPRDREDPSAARCSVQPRAVALVFSAFDAGRRVALGDAEPSGFFVAFSWHSGQAGQSCRMYFKAINLRIRASMHLIAF